MADTDKIYKRLEKEFEFVETYIIGKLDSPVWFACNMDNATFRVVGIYLDSEIGGYFTIDDAAQMEYVRDNFDATQAEDLINTIISKIENGEAHILGDMDKDTFH